MTRSDKLLYASGIMLLLQTSLLLAFSAQNCSAHHQQLDNPSHDSPDRDDDEERP